MNKKVLVLSCALLAAPMASFADTGPGCGWGAMLFNGQDGLGPNVLAATTNNTFGNQTFGMTSGTAGCDGKKAVTMSAADKFLDSNIDKVAKDMATGQGESLETLAGLLGIEDSEKTHFYSVTQKNFGTIFSKPDSTSKEVLESLKTVMQQDSTLAKYVS